MPNGNKQKQATALEYNKYILKNLLVNWKEVVEKDKSLLEDKKLCNVIRYVKEYSELDSATSPDKEGQLHKKIFTNMEKYSKDLTSKMELSDDPKLAIAFSMMSSLNDCFMAQRDGYLKKPAIKDNHIVSHDNQIEMGKEIKNKIGKIVSCKDVPLFAKEPSPEDLQTGSMENSSIRAALGTVMQKNPNYVKESMLDNNDGTVTVRLFQPVQPVDQGANRKNHEVYKPVYVTVDKSLPETELDQNALWVGIYEKALMASGMFHGDKEGAIGRAVPANIDQLYDKYRSLPKTEWPTRQECPWLINENGELHKWKPSYEHISNIQDKGNFLEAIIGDEGRSNTKDIEYHPEREEDYKKGQVLGAVYSQVIRSQTGSRKDELRVTGIAKRCSKGNPEMFVKNMQLCAALVSSFPEDEVEKYLKNVKTDKDGKITSFPVTPEQKLLEYLGDEISERISQEINNGDMERCKTLLSDAVSQADQKVKNDSDPQIAAAANEKGADSLKNLTDIIRRQGTNVFTEITGYTKEQNNIFKDLETTLEKGLHLVAGTQKSQQDGVAKEQEKDKLLSNDSYGIVGVSKEIIGGKEYKFVHMTGTNGIEYDYSKNPPLPMENKEAASNGVVKVELDHFCNAVHQLTTNGREAKKIELPEDMLTRSTISQYSNFLSYFENQLDKEIKGMKDQPAKEEFEKLKAMLGTKKGELSDNLGKDMKSVSFDKVKEQADKCTVTIENQEKINPRQLKTLKRLAKVMRLYETGMKNPKGLLLDSMDKSMQKDNMLDHYEEGNCAKTVINSHNEILNLKKGLDKVDSRFMDSSIEFENMKESLDQLGDLMKDAKPGSIPRQEYTEALRDLFKNASAYLEYKEEQRGKDGDSIRANSSGERARIDMATKIRDYASVRCQMMNHQNLRDALRLKTYEQLTNLTPSSKLSEQQKEFRKIVNSDTLNTILDKADDKTIKKILENPEAAKQFADKVDLKRSKSNEMSPLEKYTNAAIKGIENKEDPEHRRENLGRLFLADALKSINPNMKMGEIRKYEKELFDYVLSSNALSNSVVEGDFSKLGKKGALRLVDKYAISFRRELKDRFKEVKDMENKSKEDKSKENDNKQIQPELEDKTNKTNKTINKVEKEIEEEMVMGR